MSDRKRTDMSEDEIQVDRGRRRFLTRGAGIAAGFMISSTFEQSSGQRIQERVHRPLGTAGRIGGYTANTLREIAASSHLLYGAAAHQRDLVANADYAARVAAECGVLVPQDELKWDALRPAVNSFDFRLADWMVTFAAQNNMALRGHCLVWHLALPSWFAETATPANAATLLNSHIAAVVGRYQGVIQSWDVVNEAIRPSDKQLDSLRVSPWLNLLGPGYIELAFRAAAAANPSAQLVYNETGLEYDTNDAQQRRDAVLSLLSRLRAADVPVHALGIQGHLDASETRFSSEKLQSFIRSVTALGLKVLITELDVTDYNLTSDIPTRDALVAAAYSQFLGAVMGTGMVRTVVTWGLSDQYTWLNNYKPRPDGGPLRPLPLTADLQQKPAWKAIANRMEQSWNL